MIRFTRILYFLSLFTLSFFSYSQTGPVEVEPLFYLGNEPYGLQEFDYYFLKNAEDPHPDSAKIKVNEYLDLYVNFRLKVKEAKAQGKDQTLEFKEEFEGYKKQLAEPYLTQTQINEEMVREAYDRLGQEVSAAHILVKSDPDGNPEDTLKAYQKALSIKKRIEKGEEFEALAKTMSDDPSARQNGGYLGYFTALQMVYPFESAVYESDINKIAGPVKTRFGYHIIKVLDKRPARGQVLAAHIMIRSGTDSTSSQIARNKALSIRENIMSGADWNEQCKLYSEDMRTKPNGGQLQWFGSGQLVPEFENAAFSLQTSGEITEPVKTRFGWHLIKLIDKKGLAPIDEMKAELEKKISRDSRGKDKKSEALAKLKKTQNFKLNDDLKEELKIYFDSALLDAQWSYDRKNPILAKTLFTTNNREFKVEDFFKFVHEKQKRRKLTALDTYVYQLYNQFEQKSIFDEELSLIEANNYDYQMLLDEYKSGILLFNQMEEEVWNKALVDTTGLRAFYEKNKKKNYQMDEHAVVRKYVSKDSSVLQQVSNQLSMSNSELDSLFNKEEPLTLQTFDEKIERGKNDWLDQHWQVGSSIEADGSYFILWRIDEIRPSGFKALNKIRGRVITDYQNELESQWLKKLKKKYPLKLNKAVLKAYIEKFEN